MDINIITLNAINSYYKLLREIGHCSQKEVRALLLLTFINDIIEGYQEYISDEDYLKLVLTVDCLNLNSCLINVQNTFMATDALTNLRLNTPIKVTEDDALYRICLAKLRITD